MTPESVSVPLTNPFKENKQLVVVKGEILDFEEVIFESELPVSCFFPSPPRCARKRGSGEIKARQPKIARKRSGGALTCQGYKFVRVIDSVFESELPKLCGVVADATRDLAFEAKPNRDLSFLLRRRQNVSAADTNKRKRLLKMKSDLQEQLARVEHELAHGSNSSS